ncbi:AsmA family protein [Robertkochia sediminum]|uniref:AsmA family protein n=1 Tax=Robertkochia sediminum TaxID=2785326 RepID=UPI001932D5DD|nr:AsmA-like C-terminal region-containing protein [Robertkochia sediminum]MBL7472386.1 AsmA family protein [Robertkochia sediminum]
MKKFIRIALLTFSLLISALVLLPILFKDKIAKSVKEQINAQVNARVDFEDARLSLLSSFPNMALGVKGLSVVNIAPFEGDTLFYAERIDLDMPLKTLFASGVDPYTISHFKVSRAQVNLVTDAEGRANYDIAKADTEQDGVQNTANAEAAPATGLRLERYEFEDVSLVYEDRGQSLVVALDSLYHSGKGDLSAQNTVLSTNSSALLTVVNGETTYLNRNNIDWEAAIAMDLEAMTFDFKDNTAHINRLPLIFEGGVAMPGDEIAVDLRFTAPSTEFTRFLSLIPEAYSGDLEGVNAGGRFTVKGEVNGVYHEERIPRFDIAMEAEKAFFKYAEMPLTMEEITLRSRLANTTERVEDTYLRVDTLHFKLAGDRMDMVMKAEALGASPKIELDAHGVLNLENFAQLMPAETLQGLQGVLKLDMSSGFDMAAIEREDYAAIRNRGAIEVTGMKFNTPYLPKEVTVASAVMTLDDRVMTLKESRLTTGNSDLQLQGQIDDYLQAVSETGVVKGTLRMESGRLEVADLVDVTAAEAGPADRGDQEGTQDAGEDENANEPLLPANLDLTIRGKAKEVVYDDITLNNASVFMKLADQNLEIRELSSEVFGGRIGLEGKLNGATHKPDYQMDIKASGFDLADAFAHMNVLKGVMPLARALEGELNGSIQLSGLLGSDMLPVLNSLTGGLAGNLTVEEVKQSELGFVQSLNSTLSFMDLSKLGGKALKGSFEFQDGKVTLQPVAFNLNGVEATLGGTHEFDGAMDYTLTLQMPASYLGSEVSELASSVGVKDLDSRKIPVDVLIGGGIKDPKFTTNLDKATANFIAQLSEEKKAELVEKGKGELGKLVEQVIGGEAKKEGDSAATDPVKETAKDLLNNLFKKKKKDTTNKQ